MQYLAWIFLISVILEVLSIIFVASWLGGWATLGLMILAFALGLFILRRNAGFSKILMAGELLRSRDGISFYQMMWPVRIPMAGFLLMLPGFLSSLIALALLLPLKGKTRIANARPFRDTAFSDDDIIDGEIVRKSKKHDSRTILEHRNNE